MGDLEEKVACRACFGKTKSPANSDFKDFRAKYASLDRSSVTPMRNETPSEPFLQEALLRMKQACEIALRDPDVKSDRKEYASVCLDMNNYPQPGMQVISMLTLSFFSLTNVNFANSNVN